MLQLYLDGKKNKLYSLFYVEDLPKDYTTINHHELEYISSKALSDINTINFQATKRALIKKGLPVRTILIQNLSERSVGQLTAHNMLEIITLCNMFKITQ